MNQKTAEALDAMRRAVAKSNGIPESEVKMTVCIAEEIPFDENGNCTSCGAHDDDPGWCCLNCGEYIPNLPGPEEL
jgi:hypothetical protein